MFASLVGVKWLSLDLLNNKVEYLCLCYLVLNFLFCEVPAQDFCSFCSLDCFSCTFWFGRMLFLNRGTWMWNLWIWKVQRRRGQGEAEVVSGSPKSFPVRSWVLASPRAGNDQNLRCRGLGPLGLLALLGVRVHWPEFWGSGHCSPLVNASAITHPRG